MGRASETLTLLLNFLFLSLRLTQVLDGRYETLVLRFSHGSDPATLTFPLFPGSPLDAISLQII